ncbi:MAG: hypothetical protein J7599_07435 [Niabella sp.]|nr:hypothetical protein [Niabella sp.]
MSVKAKFNVWGIQEPNETNENRVVTLGAVTDGSEENKSFSKYTPSGQVIMNISPETAAYDYFKPGKDYYLTFDEVPE